MKIKKRIIIIADILVDEDFDTDYLTIAEWIDMGDIHRDCYVGESDNFELLKYISKDAIELVDEPELCKECGKNVAQGSGRFINRVVDFDGGFTCAECDEKLRDKEGGKN